MPNHPIHLYDLLKGKMISWPPSFREGTKIVAKSPLDSSQSISQPEFPAQSLRLCAPPTLHDTKYILGWDFLWFTLFGKE